MITYKLKRKSETNEWVVRAYVDGKFNEGMTYYTDDKQDAIDTMAAMKQQQQQQQPQPGQRVSVWHKESPKHAWTLEYDNVILHEIQRGGRLILKTPGTQEFRACLLAGVGSWQRRVSVSQA
jgi:hypothetical protein